MPAPSQEETAYRPHMSQGKSSKKGDCIGHTRERSPLQARTVSCLAARTGEVRGAAGRLPKVSVPGLSIWRGGGALPFRNRGFSADRSTGRSHCVQVREKFSFQMSRRF
jgi:hypothetical protein